MLLMLMGSKLSELGSRRPGYTEPTPRQHQNHLYLRHEMVKILSGFMKIFGLCGLGETFGPKSLGQQLTSTISLATIGKSDAQQAGVF